MTQLKMPGPGIPLPVPSAVSQPFWDGCARGALLFQRCRSCSRAIFNPASICRYCTSADLTWQQSTGQGAIYSWTVAWRPQDPAFEIPYACAIIDLDEGYQMIANVAGCATDDLCVGMRVAVFFRDVGQGVALPIFRPTRDSD